MSEIEHIKEMIASVNPDDTGTLDEIDVLVAECFFTETEYHERYYGQSTPRYRRTKGT